MPNVTENFDKNINTDILHHPTSIGEVHTLYAFSTLYGHINPDASYIHGQHMVIVMGQRDASHFERRLDSSGGFLWSPGL